MPRFPLLLVLCLSGCGFFFPIGVEPEPDPVEDAGEVSDGGITMGLDRVNCTFNGKRLYGQVKYVTSFPDIRVKEVTSLPRLRVERVTALANRCGEWEEVTSLPDLKVQLVDSFPDLTIEYVTSFPGLSN